MIKKLIRKMLTASGGPIHYSRTMTADNLSKAANYVGEYILKGLGTFGKIMTAPLTGSPLGTATVVLPKTKKLLDAERKIRETQELLIGRASTWLSPLNYGTALITGNGLNARKGEEKIASWSPAWQAIGRLGELYVGPKALKETGNYITRNGKAYLLSRELNKSVKNTNIQPRIVRSNTIAQRASRVSDRVFDRLYLRAINSEDPSRIQAVRNLHFSAKSPNNHFINWKGLPELHYHGTRFKFNQFKREKIESNSAGVGIYTTPKKAIAESYMSDAFPDSHVKNVYIYGRTPYIGPREGAIYLGEKPLAKYKQMYSDFIDRLAESYKIFKAQKGKVSFGTKLYLQANPDMIISTLRDLVPYRRGTRTFKQIYRDLGEEYPLNFSNLKLADSYSYRVFNNPSYYPLDVVLDPGRIKLSDMITYDDAGNIIPISKRDNFNISDIRYKKGGKMNIIKLFKNGGQVRKMQTGSSLQLTPEELKYLEWSKMTPKLKREYRNNRINAELQRGPNITSFWEAFQTYIGNRDPKNPNLNVGIINVTGTPMSSLSTISTVSRARAMGGPKNIFSLNKLWRMVNKRVGRNLDSEEFSDLISNSSINNIRNATIESDNNFPIIRITELEANDFINSLRPGLKQGGKMNILEFLKNGNKIKKALWGTNLDVDNRSDTTRQGSGIMPDSAYGAADASNTGGLLSLLDIFNTVKDIEPRNVTLSNGKQITIPGVLTGTPTFLPTFGPGLLLQGRLVNYVMNPAEKAARADFLKSADEIKTLAGSGHIPKGVQGDWMYPTEILKKYKLKQFSTPVKQEASNLLKITKLSETSSAKKTSSLRSKEYYSKKKEDRNNGVSKVRSRLVLNNKAQTTGDMRAANTGRPRRAARYTDLKTELEKDKGFWGKQYNIIRRKIALGKQGAESKEKEFLESYWNYKQKGILNKEKFGGILFKKGGIIKAEDGTKLTEEQKKISWGKLVYPEIVSALDAIGVNREYAPYVFAMSANESGWGLNPSGQNNYFGMKAGKNQKGTVVTTHEGYGNNRVKIRDKFLDYSSLSDSINQAVRRLNDKFNAFSVPVELFAMNLYQNRYYTNSPANYHDTVNGIVNGKLIKKVLNETKLPDYRMPLVLDWNSTPQWTMKNLY